MPDNGVRLVDRQGETGCARAGSCDASPPEPIGPVIPAPGMFLTLRKDREARQEQNRQFLAFLAFFAAFV
jgi:hypothetical protein